MYKEGHAGLSLLLFSPFMFLFRSLGVVMNYVLLTGLLMVALSSLPDLDMEYKVYIRHRGITHTIPFGVIVGVVFAILLGYAYGSAGWLMGFVAGFGGVGSHLLGDAFTYHKFKPLYPFSHREIAYGFFKASNKVANRAFLIIGVIAFIISYESAIL